MIMKGSPANAGDAGDAPLIPGSWRSHWVRNGNRLQYSCLEDSMDREAWQGTVHGATESDTAEHTAQQHTEMIMKLFCAKYKYSLKIS